MTTGYTQLAGIRDYSSFGSSRSHFKGDALTQHDDAEPEPVESMQKYLPERESITPDTPLRLSVAAALAYPDGSMTASGLRREAKRGRLAIERTAGKDYTTLANINRMRELCRVEKKASGSGFAAHDGTTTATDARRPGSSSMGPAISPQDALRRKLQQRKKNSPPISRRGTNQAAKNATSN